MKNIIKFLLYIIAIFLLCLLLFVLLNMVPISADNFFTVIARITSKTVISNSIGELPSWNGIVPGETSKQEFLNIVNSLPFVGKKPVTSYDDYSGELSDLANFNLYPIFDHYYAARGTAFFYKDYVAEMSFAGNIGLRIEDVIHKFGLPEFIYVEISNQNPFVHLFYPSHAIAFSYKVNNIEYRISPKDEITSMQIAAPLLYQELMKNGWFTEGHKPDFGKLYSWKGYGVIKEKYWIPTNNP